MAVKNILLVFMVCYIISEKVQTTRHYRNSKLNFLSDNDIELVLNGSKANSVIFGDWGGLPVDPYSTLVEQNIGLYISKLAQMVDVHFQLILGDNFYFDGVESLDDKRFNNTFENVFDHQSLDSPWFVILGNHDHLGNTIAQIEYTKKSHKWIMPDYNYSISIKTNNGQDNLLHVLMIDTVLLCGNSGHDFQNDSEMKFSNQEERDLSDFYFKSIENHLRKINYLNFTYVLVAGHYPVFSVAEHGPTQCLVEKLRPLLHKYKVNAYLAGHEHDMEHLVDTYLNTTVHYVISGAANIPFYSKKHENDVPIDSLKYYWASEFQINGAVCLMEADQEKLSFSYLETSGKTLYKFDIKNEFKTRS